MPASSCPAEGGSASGEARPADRRCGRKRNEEVGLLVPPPNGRDHGFPPISQLASGGHHRTVNPWAMAVRVALKVSGCSPNRRLRAPANQRSPSVAGQRQHETGPGVGRGRSPNWRKTACSRPPFQAQHPRHARARRSGQGQVCSLTARKAEWRSSTKRPTCPNMSSLSSA